MSFEMILTILFAGFLSNNYALLHFLGTGAVIENERSSRRSLIVGAGTTVIMVLTTLITWPINEYLLVNASYLRILVFVIVVMVVAELVHLLAKKHIEGYCHVYTPTFVINGAVLGLCIHNTELVFGEALVTAFGVGLGFTITMIVFSSLHAKLDEESIPKSFRGLPISLLIAGLIALALLAF